ncbi:hypothetical protein Q3A66_03400 [Hymenobacter sp. BT770]|uniref:DUF6799 domain-containing protein n=1 Tax=Hymenobacter sp. BT770 TaxID=2886942 RepID=UPI001D12035E|nr:DUF6799 domain-containing protein [Hymenobacter sp. BT770]MCC3152287.1 hypothetical protein [Hymenobacter sp. BT770]MDO3414100.1 hypothetical protein [Hymenobacter sp. BT770]
MSMRTLGAMGAACLMLALSLPGRAQQPRNNDGFLRRNGQMEVVRNGQPRPMTRDARLPTGAVVTKDGFIVSPDGQRTELRDGQGCDLRGRPVKVLTTASGALALGTPVRAAAPQATPEEPPTRSVLQALFGESADDEDKDEDEGKGKYKVKKAKKHHGKGKGKGHGRWKGEDD